MFHQQKKPFFLVWTPATGYTRKRHHSVYSAEKEAQRLANLNTQFKYHVLMALGKCTADEVQSNEV